MAFDLLEKHHRLIWNCQSCSTCQRGPQNVFGPTGSTPDRICPSYDKYRRLTYSAQGRLLAAKALMEGDLDATDDFVESLFECTLCGACGPERYGRAGCCMQREQVRIFRDFRADLVKMGKAPTEPYKKIGKAISETGNRFGFAPEKSKRTKWAEGMDIPNKADIVFFVGCVASYRKKEIAQATAKILEKSGSKFAIIGDDEKCCGNPLVNSGQYDDFESIVKHNVDAIKKTGAKKVMTSCACCYHVLKHRYPEVAGELDFEVVHSSVVFSELIEAGKLKPEKSVSGKFTFQDPCNLTRVSVTEGTHVKEPRNIINSIPDVEFAEMEGTGMYTQCCGRNPVETPNLATNSANQRIKDAKATGADTIVTSCSFCDWSISKALRSNEEDMKSTDITMLLAESLGL
jgi:heterodisulfide reductase subunit D